MTQKQWGDRIEELKYRKYNQEYRNNIWKQQDAEIILQNSLEKEEGVGRRE